MEVGQDHRVGGLAPGSPTPTALSTETLQNHEQARKTPGETSLTTVF